MINVNTRYLIVEPLAAKTTTVISTTICHILNTYDVEINTIKIDGERGFNINKDIAYVNFSEPIDYPPGMRPLNPNRLLVPGIYEVCYNILDTERYHLKKKTFYDSLCKATNINAIKILLAVLCKTTHGYSLTTTKNEKITLKKAENAPKYFDSFLLNLDNIIDYKMCDINVVVNSGKFTLAHKIVDRVINTIRNAFGHDIPINYRLMKQLVDYYNNTPHSSLRLRNYEIDSTTEYIGSGLVKPPKYIYLSPAQMQHNVDLEWQYIRMMRSKLQDINMRSLLTYHKGNIILVHIDYGKTQQKFQKQRRVFNEIAMFLAYDSGNVACKIFNKQYTQKQPCDFVPIIYTKLVANSYEELSDKYKAYFNV